MLDVAIRRSAATVTTCRLDGELVSAEAPVIRALRGRLANAKSVLVDLRGVGRFDRPGLGALVGVLRGAHPGSGRVKVCADQPLAGAPVAERRAGPPLPAGLRAGPGQGRGRGDPMSQGVGDHDLVIVANRLPVHHDVADAPWEPSPGGLVRAMLGVVRKRRGAWVGWSGLADDVAEPFQYDGIPLAPVALSPEDIAGFYDGFANDTLWPLYHDAIRAPTFDAEWWSSYVAVNERFAETTARVAARGATVWVHDYHLQLVPACCATAAPTCASGSSSTSRSRRRSCSCGSRGGRTSCGDCSVPTSSASSGGARSRTSSAARSACST